MIIIPWIGGAAWRQEIAIQRRTYVLRARWNQEASAWTLDIADRNERPIVNGIRLVCGQFLTRLHVDERLPDGDFIVIGSGGQPDFTSFANGDAQLLFLTSGEVANVTAV